MTVQVVGVKGVKELLRKLKKLAGKEAKGILRKATRKGAKVIQQQAKSLAPVRTGALAKAIKIKSKSRKGSIGHAAEVKKDDAFYGAFQEYGTKTTTRGTHYLERAAHDVGQRALETTAIEIAAELRNLGING